MNVTKYFALALLTASSALYAETEKMTVKIIDQSGKHCCRNSCRCLWGLHSNRVRLGQVERLQVRQSPRVFQSLYWQSQSGKWKLPVVCRRGTVAGARHL